MKLVDLAKKNPTLFDYLINMVHKVNLRTQK